MKAHAVTSVRLFITESPFLNALWSWALPLGDMHYAFPGRFECGLYGLMGVGESLRTCRAALSRYRLFPDPLA